MKKTILALCLLCTTAYADFEQTVKKSLTIEPHLKIGKMENGNRFAEIQYAKFDYYFSPKVSLEGGFSTGFTAARQGGAFNHAINRIGVKATYRPFDALGFFVEGSFTDNIAGQNNPADYFVYGSYQAVGVSLLIREYKIK
jgi:hypothetical protein